MIELLLMLSFSCTDINKIVQRLIITESLTVEEKKEVVHELERVVPNCKVEIVL